MTATDPSLAAAPLDRPWKRLKAARIAAGFRTAKQFSDTLGIVGPTYNNHERPTRKEGGKGRQFSVQSAERYAEELGKRLPGVTADWLLYNVGPPPMALGGPGAADEIPDMPRDLPIVGTARGGLAGSFHLGRQLALAYRPPGLAGVDGVNALWVEGSSMAPVHPPGELRFANPDQHWGPGDDVVVRTERYQGAGDEWFVKRLVEVTDEDLVVEQLNPPATHRIGREFVVSVHRIPGLRELFAA